MRAERNARVTGRAWSRDTRQDGNADDARGAGNSRQRRYERGDVTGPERSPRRSLMTARSPDEPHRVVTPLELLFDLTFVAAISQVVSELAHGISGGHVMSTLGPFAMCFFAVWWAWMNFTWFASAYDCDDVTYRLTTFVQMAGVLVLAGGVGRAFEGDFASVTVGYIIMRSGLVAGWLRAARAHPSGRSTAIRYATGLVVCQALWTARLALPEGYGVVAFTVLVALELSVPAWAERAGGTTWHPVHIAERFGLFTIILLGETVIAATSAVRVVIDETVTTDVVVISMAGMALLATMWWLYFADPAGPSLRVRRTRSFVWGYGHFVLFAALAALGAGLEVAVSSVAGHDSLDARVAVATVAVPVVLYLGALRVVHDPEVLPHVVAPGPLVVSVLVAGTATMSADRVGVGVALTVVAAAVAGLLVSVLAGAGPESDTA